MIVATRLNAVWRVAGIAAAALCCYLVSQSVASERAALEKVDHQIADTHDDIAKLQTEIGVRARQGQLEAWNRDVLALQAPRPGQFVSSGVQLASLYGHHGQPALQLDPSIVSQSAPTNVAYHPAEQPAAPVIATADAPPPATPMLRAANYVRPAPSRLGGMPGVDAPATVQKASFEMIKTPAPIAQDDAIEAKPARSAKTDVHKASEPKPLKTAEAKPTEKAKAKAEPIRLAARDPFPRSLLPADISTLAAHEAKGAKDSFKAAR
jgi:hypothetical protein